MIQNMAATSGLDFMSHDRKTFLSPVVAYFDSQLIWGASVKVDIKNVLWANKIILVRRTIMQSVYT